MSQNLTSGVVNDALLRVKGIRPGQRRQAGTVAARAALPARPFAAPRPPARRRGTYRFRQNDPIPPRALCLDEGKRGPAGSGRGAWREGKAGGRGGSRVATQGTQSGTVVAPWWQRTSPGLQPHTMVSAPSTPSHSAVGSLAAGRARQGQAGPGRTRKDGGNNSNSRRGRSAAQRHQGPHLDRPGQPPLAPRVRDQRPRAPGLQSE